MKNSLKKTLIFFGAGSTSSLGFPTTNEIENILFSLSNTEKTIKERLKGIKISDKGKKDIETTLKLLQDGNGESTDKHAYKLKLEEKKKLIERFTKKFGVDKSKFERFIDIYIFPRYDWLALKSIIIEMKKISKEITIQDILSIISKAYFENMAIPSRELFPREANPLENYLNTKERLRGALNAYKLIIFKVFKYIFMELANIDKKRLKSYERFALDIINLNTNIFKLDVLNNSNINLASLNWDIIWPYIFFKKVNEINNFLEKQNKRILLSYGTPLNIVKLKKKGDISFIFDNSSIMFINHLSVKKRFFNILMQNFNFFLPHGSFNIRICPKCKNTFAIFPDDIGNLKYENLYEIFLLDIIPTEDDVKKLKDLKINFSMPSQINCNICGTPTFLEDTFLEIQSVYKQIYSPAIEKIYIDYTITFSDAEHIIFIGYSFPQDDLLHLLSLLSMTVGKRKKKKFSVILYSKNSKLRKKIWLSYEELENFVSTINDRYTLDTINNYAKLCDKENIRFSFLGFPYILEKEKTSNILNWKIN